MIITNSTPDDYYYEQLLVFLMSIKINSPTHLNQVMVFLANYPDEKFNELRNNFPEIIFENNELKMIDARGFSLIIDRVARVFECLNKFKENVIWMDTDVIVRGDISELTDIKPKQLKILLRPKAPRNAKINAGIFNIGYSIASCNFINDWYKGVLSNKKWGMGQLEMWKSIQKHKTKIELIDITKIYNSVGGCNKDYKIWHCKKGHFDNHKYQKEYKIYLKKVKKMIKKREEKLKWKDLNILKNF
jgi:hypothetical protein